MSDLRSPRLRPSPFPPSFKRPVPRLGPRLELALMLAPYLAGLALLFVLPALLTAPIALTDFDALTPPRWAGLRNFERMFADEEFWNGLLASLAFVAVAVPLRLVGALLAAMLFHRPG